LVRLVDYPLEKPLWIDEINPTAAERPLSKWSLVRYAPAPLHAIKSSFFNKSLEDGAPF
jgi:hypothetical protein